MCTEVFTRVMISIEYRVLLSVHVKLIHDMIFLQVEVFWKEGGGPSRSGHCDTADAPAPPPLPIEMININESDTTMVIPNGLTREVRVFVRLVCVNE